MSKSKWDVTADRGTFEECRRRIRATRIAYTAMMRKRFDALPKSKRMRFLAEMPERMRAFGMYSHNTLNTDIQSVIIRQWYRTERAEKNWLRGYETWQKWQADNGINFLEARREYQKMRLEAQMSRSK